MTHIIQHTGLAHQPTTKRASTITPHTNPGAPMRKRTFTPTTSDLEKVPTHILIMMASWTHLLSPAGKRNIAAVIKSRKTSENQAH